MTEKELFIILTDNDKIEKADAVVLLEGDGLNRIARACSLLKEGTTDKLIFSGGIENRENGSFPYQICLPYILSSGIKEEQIIWESTSKHTREQAVNIIDLCEQYEWKSILLVASHYHQYRAFLTFLKVLEERDLDRKFSIINTPVSQLNWFVSEEWGRRFELLKVEFEKIEHYKQLGHICDYKTALAYYQWRMSL